MKRLILTLIVVLLAAPAMASKPNCSVLLIAQSIHGGGVDFPREFHPALGLACARWSGGYYLNSEDRHGAWAARRWKRGRLWWEAGLAANYDAAPVLPFVRVGVDLRWAEMFLAPAYDTATGKTIPVVAVQLKLPVSLPSQ